jgi:oxygen-independent coproporphyrinogen-3 oxidase
MVEEIHLRSDELPMRELDSVYFGGGTPSLLYADELESLFDALKLHFNWTQQAEITLEANPEDLQPEALHVWRSQGVNRLSIGAQSFDAKDLNWMNRSHTPEQVQVGLDHARKAGFANFSIDLIYGLPNRSMEEWCQNIQSAIELNVHHISAYCLTVEPGTRLAAQVKNKLVLPSDEDNQSKQFMALLQAMEEAGFKSYEISNFAKPGCEAVHNRSYWKGDPYLGIGPSAHSFDGNSRRWNVANNHRYMNGVGSEQNWFETEVLSLKDKWNELVLTSLRTSDGLQLEKLFTLFPPDNSFLRQMETFEQKGWLTNKQNVLVLTPDGKLLADYIASSLFKDSP